MIKEQFEHLKRVIADESIAINEIENPKDFRTLLYGYTCERHTWHVYLNGGKLFKVVYGGDKLIFHESYEEKIDFAGDIVPNKRLYPEDCDYQFCFLLKKKGVIPPFTNFAENKSNRGPVVGKTLEDFNV